jgi:hypothetical protein
MEVFMNIQSNPNTGKRVGPSRYMEIGLTVLVTALLGVSIIGIAYVYGFNLENGNLLDNISAAVRAVGVDGGFFLGLYFSRRHWTREKQGWGDSVKALLAGIPWFVVAMIMAGVSWLSNTLFVNGSTTIITQDALNKAGITIIDAKEANWMIGGIPLLIILLYSIVPSQVQTHVETRTPEEIEREAEREAARIRAQNKVAAARAEGAGQRLRTVIGGVVGEALNLEETRKRDERLKQMRIALETAGVPTDGMSDEHVEIQAVSRGVWDQKKGEAIKPKLPTRATSATLRLPEAEAEAETDEADDLDEETDTTPTGSQVSWLDANAVAAFLEIGKPTAVNWMKGDWTGPHRIQGCRNFDTKKGKVRKAPLKSVAEVKKLLDAARHSKNGATVQLAPLTREQLD